MTDPRPLAMTRCPDCWAGPDTNPYGDPHEWSCEQVPAAMFLKYVVNRPALLEGENR